MAIKTLDEYLATIPNDDNRARMVQVLNWIAEHYPELELRIAWNQSMFTHDGTDFGTMLACQPWRFAYELLDTFIQHQLAE